MTFRPQWLSQGYEDLLAVLEENVRRNVTPDFDVVIVGSGYGGAVAAARLACATEGGRRLRVVVLERGREYVPGTFPRRLADLPGHVRFSRGDQPKPKGRRDGLFDFRIGNDVSALVGSGLGGGSLINAGVAERARQDVFEDPAWPAALRRDLDHLNDCYTRAEDMMEVTDAGVDHYAKYFEFDAISMRLGVPRVRPARVARQAGDPAGPGSGGPAQGAEGPQAMRNDQGVWQKPCIGCGDCVTGCNVWAKNTLPMNYLARARRAGARLFTNVTVARISRRAGGGWKVWYHPTAEQHPPAPLRTLRAAHVILAAGAFGSTEILMRSRSRRLRLSACLGSRFSTNGDMISVLYGQGDRVNAAASEDTPLGERHVGPTITGVLETRGPRAERVLVEELAIPAALRRIFEEIITTGALPVQLGRFDWCRHGPQGQDPAAVDPEKVERSQVFASMGDDGAAGRLAMVDGWERVRSDGAICVDWPGAAQAQTFARQDRILSRTQGFGALYLRNPLWKPLPGNLATLFSGPAPEGKLFTVHPLGGCPMGDDAASGVVDDLGRVFDPPDDSEARERGNISRTHDGLLVLDGSIVPVALGVNPLLTITALAERAVEGYAALRNWTLDAAAPDQDLPALPAGIRDPRDAQPRDPLSAPGATTAVRFAETMAHEWSAPRTGAQRRLVLDVVFDDIRALPEFLRQGPHRVDIASAQLTLLEHDKMVDSAALKGTVSWMERAPTGFLSRTVPVGLTWLRLRGLADWFQRWREKGFLSALAILGHGAGAAAVCSNAGEVRTLRYDLELLADFGDGEQLLRKGTRIEGLKTFRYAGGGNPWRQLSELAVQVLPEGGGILGAHRLDVDFMAFFRHFAVQLQITAQRDLPGALLDLGSLALFMARIVFKVHFWSFRLPEYEKYDGERARRRLPQALEHLGLEMERVHVRLARQGAGGSPRGPLDLLLTRYWRGATQGKLPVLLIHGFGSSGAQFAHAGLPNNLVRHLAGSGEFDVWVAELRTSIALPSSYNQWTLDEVATEDIPALVRKVIERTGARELDVVAHCIGSAMFCTAVLAGELRGLIRRAVLLQVGPLITLSDGNIVRGRLASALRRYMLTDHVDSSVDARADWINALIDRALATYPYDEKEAAEHRLCPPWTPNTHIANCNRSAAVFGRLFQHANVSTKTLDLLGDLLGHTNLTTFEQTVHYALLGRLTDHDATNIYVSDENVRNYFSFPVRFLHGEKNDVFHPETTRRSEKLLREVFGPQNRVDRRLLPGYGHLDPLIGDNAHVNVFPLISEFLLSSGLLAASQPVCRIEVPKRDAKRPLIGPVLGWLRRDDQTGERWARIWCRTDDEQSFGYFLIAVVLDGSRTPVAAYKTPLVTLKPRLAKDVTKPVAYEKNDLVGEVNLLGVIDVPLPQRDDDYEIIIVSAHAATESNLLPATQRAGTPAERTEATLDAVLLDASDLDLPALQKSRPGHTEELPKRYAEAVVTLRKRWAAQVTAGERARRACDPGYDERPDSVLIAKALLESLAPARSELDIALASCRYPSTRVDREQADEMFGHIRASLDWNRPGSRPPSLLLLAGDQIYADATAGMYDPKGRRERFDDSYREAWSAPNAREVLRRIPTYMMMDDHEVADNWHPADKTANDARIWGETAFREYQLAHSPRGSEPAAPPYHYAFEAGGFGFFVCDTRCTREGRSRIMNARQFADLKRWLAARKDPDRPKFIVSPSVVAPFLAETGGNPRYAARSDGWDGFPDSLRDLFSLIAAEEHRNIVFLSGDPHISMACGIDIAGQNGQALRAASIVASPLYAPFPFANAQLREFLQAGEFAGNGFSMRYGLQAFDHGQNCVTGDSFALVSVRKAGGHWQVSAQVRLRDGSARTATVQLG
jgi:choline dehydrogenase-like flavoprotein